MSKTQANGLRQLHNPKNGKVIETERTDMEALAELQQRLSNGQCTDDFARDLVNKYIRYGRLSQAQLWWVHKMLEPVNECIVPATEIFKAFGRGHQHGVKVRNMRLQFFTEDGKPVVLSYAGPNSKNRGSVYVTDDDDYPDNVYYGIIRPSTQAFIGRDVPDDVQKLVAEIEANVEEKLPW